MLITLFVLQVEFQYFKEFLERFNILKFDRIFKSSGIVVLVFQDSFNLLHLFSRCNIWLEKSYQLRRRILGYFLKIILANEYTPHAPPELLIWQVKNRNLLFIFDTKLISIYHIVKWFLKFHYFAIIWFVLSYF